MEQSELVHARDMGLIDKAVRLIKGEGDGYGSVIVQIAARQVVRIDKQLREKID